MNVIKPGEYLELVNRFLHLHEKRNKLSEDQVSIIGFPFEGKTRYLMLSIEENDSLFLQLFLDSKDLHQFQENMHEYSDSAKSDAVFRLNFIQLDIRNVDDMFDEEYDAYVKAGIDLEDEVPVFRNFKSGYSVWVINEWDVSLIQTAFTLLEQLFEADELPDHGYYTNQEEKWVEEMFHVVEHTISNAVEISHTLDKLSFRKRGKWLIGSYFLPFPNTLDSSMRPVHSLVCFVVDEESEEIIHIFEAEEKKDPYVSFNEQLYSFMKENKKRPRSVAFYGEEDEDCFLSLFHHLDVEILDSNQFELLNDVWMGLEEEFMMNLEMAMELDEETKTFH